MAGLVAEVRDSKSLPLAMAIIGAAVFSLSALMIAMIATAFLHYGKAFGIFSGALGLIYGTLAGYAYGKYLKAMSVLSGYAETVKMNGTFVAPDDFHAAAPPEENASGGIDEFKARSLVRVDRGRIVRLAYGLDEDLLADLADAVADGQLTALSQRALDQAGVVSREQSVSPNAKDLISWLANNEFVTPIGNSRYTLTDDGTTLLRNIRIRNRTNTRGAATPATASGDVNA